MKIPPDKGEVLYDGLTEFASGCWSRLEARAHYGLSVEAPVVGMASRVHPGKDFETLIQAARHVLAVVPQCQFLIAGDYQQNPAHRDHYHRLQALLRETGTA